jgi:hypothetical protein
VHPDYQKYISGISQEQFSFICLNFQGRLKRMSKSGQGTIISVAIPFLATLPPKITDQNYEIAILFKK